MTKRKTAIVPTVKSVKSTERNDNQRTSFDPPEITGLNMYAIFVSFVSRVVFPAMQRGYSWKSEQLKRFLNNLYIDRYTDQDTSAIGMFELYMDSENPRAKKQLHIFNGQQRIITMFLMLCGLRDVLTRAKSQEKKAYINTINRINNIFFQTKLPNNSYTNFKIHYEGSEDMNIFLSQIADPHGFFGNVKNTESIQNLKDANNFIKNWIKNNPDFIDDLDAVNEFGKFLLDGVFFAAQYHSNMKRAESAFIESNMIQVHLTPIELIRGKLISYAKKDRQVKMANTFNAIDKVLRDNEFFVPSKKTRINEILFKHSISVHFSDSNKSADAMDFVFNTNEKKAYEIVDKYFEWAKTAVQTRNDIREGYEYMFLKLIANQKVFSWTKAVVCNMVISQGATKENRKVLLDLLITFLAMYYGNTANINTESVANEFCNHIKKNPICSIEADINRFYEILAAKLSEDRHARSKQTNIGKPGNTSMVILNLSEQLKNFSFQKKSPDRSMMRLVLCFVESILQHEITGENIYIAFKRIYDNKAITLKQISTVANESDVDYHNKLGNVTLFYDGRKPVKLYINSNFAAEFAKAKTTKNLNVVLESVKSVPNFADVKQIDEAKCKKRLDFIVAAFRQYWKPETLLKLQSTARERAVAAKKDALVGYTARVEDVKPTVVLKKTTVS